MIAWLVTHFLTRWIHRWGQRHIAVWLLGIWLLAACGSPAGDAPIAPYATAAAQLPTAPDATRSPGGPPVATATTAPLTGPAGVEPPPALASTPSPATQVMPEATAQVTPPATSFDPGALAAQMLALINRDRAAAGLGPVAWDETAAAVAAAHAADMLARDFFSHWNPDGLGPDHRYAQAGGLHVARENLHAFTHAFADGRGAPIDDWAAVVSNAQADLMNSPGHRDNILDPAHTHVGIGLAYDPLTGRVTVAQEFVNQVVQLTSVPPLTAGPGETVRLAGSFGPAAVGSAILELAYEPLPSPLPAAELAARRTYMSAAQTVETRAIPLIFDETVALPSRPGFYHLRLYVDLAGGQAPVSDRVIVVR